MRLLVLRKEQDENGTWGVAELFVGPIRVFTCHTLELPWRYNEARVSCIQAGTYPAVLTYSPRFKKKLWEVLNVKGRSAIRIHAANYVRELQGCIALGMSRVDIDKDGTMDVARSKEAMELFMTACYPHQTMTVEVRPVKG